jgi:hypothetical protein
MKPLGIGDAFRDMTADLLHLEVADLVQQRPPVEQREGRDVHRHAVLFDPEVAQVQRADAIDVVVSMRQREMHGDPRPRAPRPMGGRRVVLSAFAA